MDALLSFCSHIILLTFGLAVCVFWLVIFAVIAIEVHDLIFGDETSTSEDEDDYR